MGKVREVCKVCTTRKQCGQPRGALGKPFGASNPDLYWGFERRYGEVGGRWSCL